MGAVSSKIRRKIRPRFVQSGHAQEDIEWSAILYSSTDPNITRRVNVLIDTGNAGPNLITDDAMQHVRGIPRGGSTTIIMLNGEEMEVGGEVELQFSRGSSSRLYKETFCHIPDTQKEYDMILNRGFYLELRRRRAPLMFTIRNGRESKEEKKRRKDREQARELLRDEAARRQEGERQADRQAAEAQRYASGASQNSTRDSSSGSFSREI